MLARYTFLFASAVACGSPVAPPPAPINDVREATVNDAGVRATNDVRVTKQAAKPNSCWSGRGCSGNRVCEAPEDPTFGGCAAPGCREHALHGTCASNVDCFSGYSCVLGPNEWHGGRADVWHCEEIRCKADADCMSANMRCVYGGICQAIECKSDAECDGYCIGGRCNAKPGTCVEPRPREHFQ